MLSITTCTTYEAVSPTSVHALTFSFTYQPHKQSTCPDIFHPQQGKAFVVLILYLSQSVRTLHGAISADIFKTISQNKPCWYVTLPWDRIPDRTLTILTDFFHTLYGSSLPRILPFDDTLQARGAQIFQKSSGHLKILSSRRMKWSRFHTEDTQISGAIAEN